MSAFLELTTAKQELLAADMHHDIYQFKPHKHYRAVAAARLEALETKEELDEIQRRVGPKHVVMENGEDTSLRSDHVVCMLADSFVLAVFVARGGKFGIEMNYNQEMTIWGQEFIDLLYAKYRPSHLSKVGQSKSDASQLDAVFIRAFNCEWKL